MRGYTHVAPLGLRLHLNARRNTGDRVIPRFAGHYPK